MVIDAAVKAVEPQPKENATPPRWFRVDLETNKGPVPFLLGVQWPLLAESVAVVANGAERIPLPMTCEESQCRASFDVFSAALLLTFESEQSLIGGWKRSEYYPAETVPLTGVAVDGPEAIHRYQKISDPSVDVGGSWSLNIDDVGPAKAKFEQAADGTVRGWIVPANIGDVRYLEGRVDGTRVRVSTFDGQHAYNVELIVSKDSKTLEGVWHFHTMWHYGISGNRGEGPSLEDLHTMRLKPGKKTVALAELAALRGTPVIVDLYGTWCPACIDLMPALVDLYARYHDQGLEILSIAFEPSDDPELAERQVAEFKKHYGITWKSAIRDADDMAMALEDLENADGFPITLFVNRDGDVVGMHSGFVSAAAGEEHTKLLEKLDRLTQEIVAPSQGKAP